MQSQTVKVSLDANVENDLDVQSVMRNINIVQALLNEFFIADELMKDSELREIKNHLETLYNVFARLRFVEETFDMKISPALIDLDDVDSLIDLCELCLTIRDNKVIRKNIKCRKRKNITLSINIKAKRDYQEEII